MRTPDIAPELPEGYHEMRSYSIAGDPCHELWFNEILICYLDGEGDLRSEKIIEVKHLPAIAIWLPRWVE